MVAMHTHTTMKAAKVLNLLSWLHYNRMFICFELKLSCHVTLSILFMLSVVGVSKKNILGIRGTPYRIRALSINKK